MKLPLRFGSLLLWSFVLLDGKIKAQSLRADDGRALGTWSYKVVVLVDWFASSDGVEEDLVVGGKERGRRCEGIHLDGKRAKW